VWPCAGIYLCNPLSLPDVEELLKEQDLRAEHTTIWRWVQFSGPGPGTATVPSYQDLGAESAAT